MVDETLQPRLRPGPAAGLALRPQAGPRPSLPTDDGYELDVRWTDRDRSQYLAL